MENVPMTDREFIDQLIKERDEARESHKWTEMAVEQRTKERDEALQELHRVKADAENEADALRDRINELKFGGS